MQRKMKRGGMWIEIDVWKKLLEHEQTNLGANLSFKKNQGLIYNLLNFWDQYAIFEIFGVDLQFQILGDQTENNEDKG